MIVLIDFQCLLFSYHFLTLLVLGTLRARVPVLVDDLLVDMLLELVNRGLVELACADLALEQDVHLGECTACWLRKVEVGVDDAAEADAGLEGISTYL